MSAITKITCPKCKTEFNAEQALATDIEFKLKSEYNQKFKALTDENNRKRDLEIQEAKLKQEAEYKKILETDRAKQEASVKQQLQADYEKQMNSLNAELEAKRQENIKFKEKQFELEQKERMLKDQELNMKLEMQQKMNQEKLEIEEMARKRAEEQVQMSNKEKEVQMEQLRTQIREMQRKMEQGSMQLQGEAQELVLEELLGTVFRFDEIREVAKGIRGADVVQVVKNQYGKECGKIIYESKRTKSFSDGWIEKLKVDQRAERADFAVIVTEAYPKDMNIFGFRDGVWICTFREVQGVSALLREIILGVFNSKVAETNKGDKMQLLYGYLTGNEFVQQMGSIVETFVTMKDSLEKEKRAYHKIWSEREKQMEKVIQNSASIYGSLRGIAGSAIQEIKQLEAGNLFLDAPEEEQK
ncbi:MAG: hypothetical protein K0R51_2870 [Cytophagaceae bacterium]|jgi:hypothetical protein|nr:hypothetical protein [Cytophagaceae bacterium]